jgi:hypothetical protein
MNSRVSGDIESILKVGRDGMTSCKGEEAKVTDFIYTQHLKTIFHKVKLQKSEMQIIKH